MSLKFYSVVTVACSLLASPALAKDQFNLTCRGDVVGLSPSPVFRQNGPLKLVVRVDIPRQTFCFDSCAEVEPIKTTNPTFIDMQSGDQTIRVTRATGKFLYKRDGLYDAVGSGTCETQPFSGFPKRGF